MERIWLKNYPKGVPSDVDTEGKQSLAQLIEEVLQKFKDRPAYYSMGKTLSFAQIDQKSQALAAYFQSIGLKAGDKIALMMPNILSYPIALFAAIRLGLVVVNTNPLYTAREIEHQFNDSGAKALVIAENFAAEFAKVANKTGIKHVILTSIGEMMGGVKGWLVDFVVRKVKKMVPAYSLPGAVWMASAIKQGAGKSFQRTQSGLDEVVCLQYTGGTTGVAKGAMLTNSNLLHNMFQVKAWISSSGLKEGQEVMLTPLPMYHVFSFTVNCLCMSSYGALNVLIVNPRDIPAVVKEIRKTRPSMMTGVNTLFNALLNNNDFQQLDFSNLKFVVGGAMAIQKAVSDRWKALTSRPLIEGYGMTETSPLISVNPLDGNDRVGTIGLPAPSTYVRIADENNNPVELGVAGEIQAKGPQVMKGYYNRPDETAKVLVDGWMKTGDVGIMDADGFVKIVDRIKDMILVSGFNVYPNEIEEVAALHPKVLEAAAIGIPDEKSGEAVKLFVVKKESSLTEDELRRHCDENLTGYKRPRHIEFRSELPKTNVGKILRRALRDEKK